MARPPETIVHDIGTQLAQKGRLSKDLIVKSLRQAGSALTELGQNSSLEPRLRPLSKSLLNPRLLGHNDKDVRILVAICFCEIMRVLAPDPSFADEEYKGIFNLYISMFTELGDISSPYFTKRVKILETVDALECCKKMLDIHCDELILKMFRTFFSIVREQHPQSVVNGMLSIMALILEEEEISDKLLEVIMENLKNHEEGPSASHQLAVKLIVLCSDRIKPAVCKYLTCCILDKDDAQSELRGCYHQIILEIFKCAPHVLTAIVPSITQELMTDQVDTRIKSLNLIGKLLTLPKTNYVQVYHQLLYALLSRLSDKVAEVRIGALRSLKDCYISDPLGPDSSEILSSVGNRLLDFDAGVRTEAVAVVCDLISRDIKNFQPELLALILERLRDKMASVRKKAVKKLLEVYHCYCTKCCEGQMTLSESFEQIPCKIMVLCYYKNLKEFRPHDLEILLAENLFPVSLSVEERTKHWIFLYSPFSGAHLKALNSLLCQKRRLQSEMRVYLSYWKKEKENDSEKMDARLKATIIKMSAVFPDPLKAKECLYSLQEAKDDQICVGLTQLLDEVSFDNAKTTRDNFLKRIGDKNPRAEFLKLLSLRCFHHMFNVEHVHCILKDICDKRDDLKDSSFNLLQAILNNFPNLLRGCEHQFQSVILESDDSDREKLIRILARAGSSVSVNLSVVFPALEKFCLEGTRSQSKLAVSAIAAIAGPSKQCTFADLFQKLSKSLHDGRNILTVLQSLGCIAHHSDLALDGQNEISSFIKERIFEENESVYSPSLYENSRCSFFSNGETKIYGIKTLVKLLLPKKGADDRHQLDDLVYILLKLLQERECAGLSLMSGNDADLVRLAAAKSILRLSARWDTHISPKIFKYTVMLAKDNSFSSRRLFLGKTRKLLKKHAIPNRYACTFLLASSDCMKAVRDEAISYLAEFIEEFSASNGGNMTDDPAYIVVYLIYMLAHDGGFPHGDCRDAKVFAHFCRPLFLLVHSLRNALFVTGETNLTKSSLVHLLSLFRAVKQTEDAIDPRDTHKLHKLADIGSYFVRVVKPDGVDLSLAPCSVLLPSSLYKTSQLKSSDGSTPSPAGFSFDERFLKEMTKEIEDTFDQPSTSFCTLKCNLDSQMEVLRANSRDDLTANMSNVISIDGCREGVDHEKIVEAGSVNVGSNEGPDVSVRPDDAEELDGSGDPEADPRKNAQLVDSYGTSTFSQNESHLTSETLDALIPDSTLQDHKRKSSTNSCRPHKSSKTKEAAVPCAEAQRFNDQSDQSSLDETNQTVQNSGVFKSKGKVLCDRTNSLIACAANNSKGRNQKKQNPEKRQRVAGVPSPLNDDGTKDSIAYRTRRRA